MDTISADAPDAIARAAAALDAGELVIVPGDLSYLLVGDALDDDAVERIFQALGRGADRPLTVLLGGLDDLRHVGYGGPEVSALANEHWPGPTVVRLRARAWVPDMLTGGAREVDVTLPAQAFTRALAKQFGPLATALDQEPRSASLRVEAGRLPGGEAKVIRATEPAPS